MCAAEVGGWSVWSMAHPAVFMDGYMYYAVKPPILASILCFYGATLLGPGSCQDPNSNQTNDDAIDDDVDDDDVVVMARFLELAPLLARVSCMCLCLLVL